MDDGSGGEGQGSHDRTLMSQGEPMEPRAMQWLQPHTALLHVRLRQGLGLLQIVVQQRECHALRFPHPAAAMLSFIDTSSQRMVGLHI